MLVLLLVMTIALGMGMDLLVAVAFPRFYFMSSVPLFSFLVPTTETPSFESLISIRNSNRRWSSLWIASSEERFRIGFRERLLSVPYTPVVHGQMTVKEPGVLRTHSRLNWLTITFVAWFAYFAVSVNRPGSVAFAVLVITIVFLDQRSRYRKLATQIARDCE
jgi:hypothetical protein